MDHWTENYCEKENKLNNYVVFLFTIFEKVRATCEFRF